MGARLHRRRRVAARHTSGEAPGCCSEALRQPRPHSACRRSRVARGAHSNADNALRCYPARMRGGSARRHSPHRPIPAGSRYKQTGWRCSSLAIEWGVTPSSYQGGAGDVEGSSGINPGRRRRSHRSGDRRPDRTTRRATPRENPRLERKNGHSRSTSLSPLEVTPRLRRRHDDFQARGGKRLLVRRAASCRRGHLPLTIGHPGGLGAWLRARGAGHELGCCTFDHGSRDRNT